MELRPISFNFPFIRDNGPQKGRQPPCSLGR
jgi:hypothetical protein